MTDYLAEAQAISSELTVLRRTFHRHPELGNHEYETAARIEAFLHACGIPTKRILDTAIVGTLEGSCEGQTAALRADMDALPLQEETGAEFASEVPGVMHACGHDIHLAAVLGAAKLLASHRSELPGRIVFLFQPDEEGNGGAQRMIDAGVLENVDAVFGCHVSPDLPAGQVGVRYGKFYAASDTFRITVQGKSAHGAEREKGVDALAAAAEMVSAVLALPFPHERSVVSVGTLHAGTAGNIVADHAEFTGIIRTLGQESRNSMRARFTHTIKSIAHRHSVETNCELRESYPGVVNDSNMTRLVQDTAADLLGADRVTVITEPTMTTEDFGCFLLKKQGSFYHIGAGCVLPLHNASFLPDDSAILIAAALHAAVAESFLKERIP